MTDDDRARGRDGKCGARKRQNGDGGETCTLPAGWGTPHPGYGPCKLHGGSTRNHVAAARAEQARRAVATYGLPVDVDPATALLQEVHRTAGHVAWLGEKVAELDAEGLVWGVAETTSKQATEYPGTDTVHAARPSVWLDLYQRERTHLVRVSKAALDAGVSERLVRLAEQQGMLLAQVIRQSTDELLGEVAGLLDEATAAEVRQRWSGWVARIVPAKIAAVTTSSEES
jgi:hypothetical protein